MKVMKKSLKEELVSVAHKILQLKEGSSYEQITEEARAVYEKLAVLAYAERLENASLPTIGKEALENGLQELAQKEVVVDEASLEEPQEKEVKKQPTPGEIAAANQEKFEEARSNDEHRPDGTLFNDQDPVHEPVIEKIKDMVAEMPPEAAAIDDLVESIEPKSYQKNDMFEIGGEYGQTPIFEPVTKQEDEKPKNLNERLKSGLKVGLNDKLAFIKHLFDGSDSDYNRVLSQLETFTTITEAQDFIDQMVKPDYANWEGKEEYEERFIQVVSNKFE